MSDHRLGRLGHDISSVIETATRTSVLRSVSVEDPEKVMAAAVTALLGPEEADPADVRAAAEAGLRLLQEKRETVLATITTSQPRAESP